MPAIRRLNEPDIDALIALRREALLSEPAAFLSSPDADAGQDPVVLLEGFRRPSMHATFGAFDPDLVGVVGVHRARRVKEAHKAEVNGMYVRLAHRQRGVGAALLAAAIEFARSMPAVTHLHLSVSESQTAALRLYERMGFVTWGVEPAAMQVDGVVIAVRHMVLPLASRPELPRAGLNPE